MLMMMATLPDAYWDAWLLRQFPGRTLEELDGIDWTRLARALHVREIERVEELYPLFFKDKWKPSSAEWRMILRHNRLENENG
ncbi:MAG: hypothetical protein KDD91_21465 [Caldilinea sp.]|nr:hypothetical protein [Caldilinea sp.]